MSTYVPIQAITLSANASSIEFTGIPQTYTDLVLVAAGTTTTGTPIEVRVGNNGIDTNSNYSLTRLYGNGTTASSDRFSNNGFFYTTGNFTDANNVIHFMNYSSTTTNKTVLNRTNSPGAFVGATVGLWRSTSAITNIRIYVASNNLSSGSTFTLYGIGSGAPKAFGGDRVVTDGTYWYHAFTSSGRFETAQNISCDVLVVAGGGGGGANAVGEGGGGAGGLLYFSSQALSGAYTVTVGSGGAVDTKGGNSSFGSLTAAVGGGRGASAASRTNIDGGSGGGGSSQNATKTGGVGTSGQGNDGGTAATISNVGVGGGGGGAGAVGQNASTAAAGSGGKAGNGGNGVSTYSSFGSATSTGQNISGTYWFAGGGGGGSYDFASGLRPAGTGGNGGGGQGAQEQDNGPDFAATAGTANTGGGGGGAARTSGVGPQPAAAGGSGIVIVRYSV